MASIHKIGEPENASEIKAIKVLAERLPDNYILFHNFELTTGSGLPYEYDIVVVGDFAVWHVEVKGYRGTIQGDAQQWTFENGGVQPSPIPLANKKTKILASKLRRHSRRLDEVFVDTVILLTDELARVRIKDDQATRVIRLDQVLEHFTDPSKVPVRTTDIERLQDTICSALFGLKSSRKVTQIGLYDIVEKINQTDERTVFLARHRYIKTRPKTILKVFHFDIYSAQEEKRRQIEAIFQDQNAMRLLGAHPNLIDTGDMFAWEDNKFVLPTEYIEHGRPLSVLLQKEEDRQLSWADKAGIVAKMARGLGHAHKNGVVHRDIRPLNVVVAPDGVVKLVNFDLAFLEGAPQLSDPKGLAQRLDERYTAPEVWRDARAASRRSDIYSLGILFYELITSRTPYADVSTLPESGETPLDRELLLAELSTPGSEDFMASPKDAVDVIARMCRRDPAQRYESVDGVIEDLAILA
jgi:tRNA A-37 threonylcarbamoyl transferase component Bud32